MTFRWTLALIGLVGCRGPSEAQIAGSGLIGAGLYLLTSWAALVGVIRVWERLRFGRWPGPQPRGGLLALFVAHLALSVIAGLGAQTVREVGLVWLIWGCAAASHLAWSVLIWRVGGRLPPTMAVGLASVPCLLIALPGGFGHDDFAVAALLQWLWGGFLGATPAVIILLVWWEGWLRRERPVEIG